MHALKNTSFFVVYTVVSQRNNKLVYIKLSYNKHYKLGYNRLIMPIIVLITCVVIETKSLSDAHTLTSLTKLRGEKSSQSEAPVLLS